jgi:hypothetical protein
LPAFLFAGIILENSVFKAEISRMVSQKIRIMVVENSWVESPRSKIRSHAKARRGKSSYKQQASGLSPGACGSCFLHILHALHGEKGLLFSSF